MFKTLYDKWCALISNQKTESQKASVAREVYEQYKKADQEDNVRYWKKALFVYLFRKNDLYRYLHGGTEGYKKKSKGKEIDYSWGKFCDEIGISRTAADQRVMNWEFYIIKHGFDVEELLDYDTQSLYYLSRYRSGEPKSEIKKQLKVISATTRAAFVDSIRPKNG